MRWSRACISCPARPPRSLGHRALAVNLSDLAAMGATPAWALLSLTLPRADEAWLGGIRRGLRRTGARARVALVGGNLSRGPLSITVQLAGRSARGHGAAARARAGRRCTLCQRHARRCRAGLQSAARRAATPAATRALPARALRISDPARGARRGAARLRQRLHRCLRWPVRRRCSGCCAPSGAAPRIELERLPRVAGAAAQALGRGAPGSTRSRAARTTSCALRRARCAAGRGIAGAGRPRHAARRSRASAASGRRRASSCDRVIGDAVLAFGLRAFRV